MLSQSLLFLKTEPFNNEKIWMNGKINGFIGKNEALRTSLRNSYAIIIL